MNEIKIFENAEFGSVRTLDINGVIYFVGKDVAQALSYADTNKAIAMHVDDEDKLNDKTASSLGQRGGWLITESGLYSLILSSKLPNAKKFKRWVTSEVLPSIRKDGAYMTEQTLNQALTSPDFLISLATKLKKEQEKRKELEMQAEQDKPKVIFANAVAVSKTSILVGDLAKILKQNGIDIGANRLFKWLRENNYLISRKGSDYNSPTQRAMEMKLFEVKETVITHSDGHTSISKTSKVTGKGQQYFINCFLSGALWSVCREVKNNG